MGATLRDVARAAMVSQATASRALSHSGNVSEATRRRVIEAAGEVGYHRASAGSSTSTGNIALLLPDLSHPSQRSILKSAHQRARLRGFETFVADTGGDATVERELLTAFASKADGVVLCSPRSSTGSLREFAVQSRLVLINGACDGISSVTTDHPSGIQQAVAHLRALGHRHLAYAGGRSLTYSEHQRREGLEAALGLHKLPAYVDLGRFPDGFQGGAAAADLLLASTATAVICINNDLALGLMDRLRKRGVDVPDAISIVSCDSGASGEMTSPLLTTVVQPPSQAGWVAVDLLVRRLKGPTPTVNRVLPVELLVGETTAEALRRA